MVHKRSLERVFCSVIRNVAATAANSSCLLVLRGRGERKPQVFLSLKNVTSFNGKPFEFLFVDPVDLVHYIPQRAKYNKMQSFTSLPPPDAVLSSLSYVPICTASPESQDVLLDSLLVVGICFQTL